MKKLLRFALLSFVVAGMGACDSDDSQGPLKLAVDSNNIAGTWQLNRWNNAPVVEGNYVYIEFVRKDSKYVMYENTKTAGAHRLTGRFAIETDPALGAIIRGDYDHNAGDWKHRYIVTDLTETSMTWTAKDDPSDISVYVRCDAIPDEIIGETDSE